MKHKVSSTTSEMAHEIAALRQATPADLKERWLALYCTEPPRRISRDPYPCAGVPDSGTGAGWAQAVHAPIASEGRSPRLGAPVHPGNAGTNNSQAWNSSVARVARHPASGDCREDGIVFRGKPYKSLSEVAYRITGTKWSGPRFFGLKSNHQERGDGTV